MAVHHSTPLIHTGFQQHLDSWFGKQIARVDRIMAGRHLPQCAYTDVWDVNHGMQCQSDATVSDLHDGSTLCAAHFQAVNHV